MTFKHKKDGWIYLKRYFIIKTLHKSSLALGITCLILFLALVAALQIGETCMRNH